MTQLRLDILELFAEAQQSLFPADVLAGQRVALEWSAKAPARKRRPGAADIPRLRAWAAANPERAQAARARYREAHREELRATEMARYYRDRDGINARRRARAHAKIAERTEACG